MTCCSPLTLRQVWQGLYQSVFSQLQVLQAPRGQQGRAAAEDKQVRGRQAVDGCATVSISTSNQCSKQAVVYNNAWCHTLLCWQCCTDRAMSDLRSCAWYLCFPWIPQLDADVITWLRSCAAPSVTQAKTLATFNHNSLEEYKTSPDCSLNLLPPTPCIFPTLQCSLK